MNVLLLSDIHGNRQALQAVLHKAETEYEIQSCILLGDIIDYGMHSNEVIQMLEGLTYPVICNILGNHENAVLNQDYSRFSTERGKQCARYTKEILTEKSWVYMKNKMAGTGSCSFQCGGKRCLAVHGSLKDEYWVSINPCEELLEYQQYDYVFSGHSHLPHYIEKYYFSEDKKRRNKKKTIFINPGSTGQPRNLNAMAQFAVVNIAEERVSMEKVKYDISNEQEAYRGQVDEFYKYRLEEGV